MPAGSAAPAASALAPIVVCVGTETWLREEAVREVRATCVAPGAEAFDLTIHDAQDVSAEAILEAAQTAPLMSPRRLVVVRGLLETTGEALDWLTRYAQRPMATTCLILGVATLPASVQAALRGVAQEVSCAPLKGGALAAWVRQRMQRLYQKTLAPDAAQAVVARAGQDLAVLAQLLDQLALYVDARPQVTVRDVTDLVGWTAEARVFAVIDGAIRRDRAGALRVARRLVDDGVAPEELLGALGKHLRRVWQALWQIERGTAPPAAAQAVGVPWHAQAPFLALLRQTSRAHVTEALEALLEVDRQLKTGGLPPSAVIEPCVWSLAGGRAQAAA